MTENPRTVLATDSVGEAVDALQSMDVRHLPVLDDEGNLVGILSDRDLGPLMRINVERAEAEHVAVPLGKQRVADLMSSDVITVDPDTDVREIIETMLGERIGAVPVVDAEGEVIGIVSYVDVLRSIGERERDTRAQTARRRVTR
jgi:CBS domain-containing protein